MVLVRCEQRIYYMLYLVLALPFSRFDVELYQTFLCFNNRERKKMFIKTNLRTHEGNILPLSYTRVVVRDLICTYTLTIVITKRGHLSIKFFFNFGINYGW